MFKSKTTMEKHKRKHSEVNRPSHNIQTQSKSFPGHLPSSFQPAIRPSFPYSMPKNSSWPSSSHIQTTRETINTNHLSSSFQPAIRPSLLYDMRQKSSSSSSSLQASVGPNVNHNSSSSSSSSRSQSSQSQPTVHEPALHQASSSDSLLSHDQDQYEKILLSEAEIIDENGSILRTQKMTAREVYKLKAGEKVLVHINKNYQLIKNSGGLCSRFMTLILQQPNLCPPDAKDWKECKDSCAHMLIAELRRRFCIPQGEKVDKVLSDMFSLKRRGIKYRLRERLYEQAANKLNEANGINELDAQEENYTDDELLAALDLLGPPENFSEQQWRVYKSNLRKPNAKKLSLCGKKARNDQVHTHTTGAVSFARTKDIYKVENKIEPNDFVAFHICYKTKDGTYLQQATRDMMVMANREISSKVKELVGPEGIAEDAVVAQIATEVFNDLLGNEEPHCYGAGVTKSQISKFWCNLRRMRGEDLEDENRFLKEKVHNQNKEIHTQKKQLEMCNKEMETCKKQLATQNEKVESYRKQVETQGLQIKNMEQKLNEVHGMLKLFPAYPNLDNIAFASNVDAGTCDKQPSSSTSPSPFMDEDHYSPVMDDPSFD